MLKSTNATPSPVPLLLPHPSSRLTPPPAPFFLPSHAANRHSGHPDVHSSVWNQSMIDFKQIKCLGWQFADVCTPEIVRKVLYLCKRCFLIGKSPFSVASPPTKIEHIIDFSWEILNKSARAARNIFKYIHWLFLRILQQIGARSAENFQIYSLIFLKNSLCR